MVVFRECIWHLVLAVALSAVLFLLSPLLSILGIALFIFTLFFFRDPERRIPSGKGLIISPADGRVLYVAEEDDPFVGKAKRIAIFMSPFDVHVNRMPISGAIASVKHTPGTKVAAYLMGDLDARERNRVEIKGVKKVAVIQYAGVVARRIAFFKSAGDKLTVGERFGMIKFGSRVDVLVPSGVSVKVKKDDRTVAGETVLGAF